MTQIIEDALRDHLNRDQERGQPFELRWVTVKGRALPGVDITDRDALYDRMEDRSGTADKVSSGGGGSRRAPKKGRRP